MLFFVVMLLKVLMFLKILCFDSSVRVCWPRIFSNVFLIMEVKPSNGVQGRSQEMLDLLIKIYNTTTM